MGLFSRRETEARKMHEARRDLAATWMSLSSRQPYKGSPQEKINRNRKTTRKPRGWL